MKKAILLATGLLFTATAVFAAPFAPTLLKLSAPSQVLYQFDNSTLSIPVTVAGKPATTLFCVYTSGKTAAISAVQNGYLGWHYVNKVDTSLFISQAVELPVGSNAIQWNGKDDDGKTVPAGEYTYYLWAYDSISPKVPVNQTIIAKAGSGGKQAHIQEFDSSGKALANPIWLGENGANKWVIGYDPADSGLVETTTFALPAGYAMGKAIALEPDNYSKVFIRIGNTSDPVQGIAKYDWVPNGQSTLDTEWAENGILSWSGSGGGSIQAGPDIVGDFLYSANNNYYDVTAGGETLYEVNWADGTMNREIDLTAWWTDVNDLAGGGQLNGGPNGVIARNGYLFLNCHCSCIKQMVNPLAETDEDFVVWTNQNGDYVLDHNFEETSARPWVCNDYKVGPYTYHLAPDANLFSVCPAYDMGAVSFGLMGPDGDGIGYFPYSGDTAGWKWFDIFVDSGSAFDGIYTDNQQLSQDPFSGKADIPGIYFVAQDSFRGVISDQVGVKEAAPTAFAVAQNSPNPFNPTTTISFTLAKAGKTTVDVYNVAGQKIDTLVNSSLSAGSHSVTWNAAKFSAGVYFYTVKSGDFSKTLKMTLLK